VYCLPKSADARYFGNVILYKLGTALTEAISTEVTLELSPETFNEAWLLLWEKKNCSENLAYFSQPPGSSLETSKPNKKILA